MLRFTEAFAKQSFQLVPFYSCWYLFTRYRKSQARSVTGFSSNQDRNTGISTSKVVLKNLLKLESTRKSRPPGERLTDARTHVMG